MEINEYDEELFLKMVRREIVFDPINTVRTWCGASFEKQAENIEFFPRVLTAAEKVFEWHEHSENFALALINSTANEVMEAYPQIYEMCVNQVINRAEQGRDVGRIFKRLYISMNVDMEEEKPEVLKNLIDYIKKNPENIVEWYGETTIAKEDFEVQSYFSGLKNLQDKGKDISLYLEKDLPVTIDELEQSLANIQEVPNQSLCLQIKDVSELSLEKLDEIKANFNIQHIKIVNNARISYEYTIDEFGKCREIIDELISGIELGNENDSNREKKIFGQIVKRIAMHMSYDHDHVKQADRVRSMRKGLEDSHDLTAVERDRIEKEMIELDSELDYITPRNMIGGLVNKTCVCAGYAEIARNVFACLGIEATYVSGFPKKEGEAGHAWNQVKLDGKWYNMDLTWDRDRIIEGEEPRHMLMATNDFNNESLSGHGDFSEERSDEHECYETISRREVHKYITYDPTKQKKNWLKGIASKCSLSHIQDSARSIIEVMTKQIYSKKGYENMKDGIDR